MRYLPLFILLLTTPALATSIDVDADSTIRLHDGNSNSKLLEDDEEAGRIRIDTNTLETDVRHDEIIDNQDGEEIQLRLDTGL